MKLPLGSVHLLFQLCPDMALQLLQVVGTGGIVLEKLLGHDHRTQVKRVALLDMASQGGGDLQAPAADIEHGIALVFHVEMALGRDHGQSGFFKSRDDPDLVAEFRGKGVQQFLSVTGAAHGAGGNRLDRADLQPGDQFPEVSDRRQCPRRSLGRYGPGDGKVLTEPDCAFFVIQDLVAPLAVRFHHDAADRIGSYIHGGQTFCIHGRVLLTG